MIGNKNIRRLFLIHIFSQSVTIVFCFTSSSCSTKCHQSNTNLFGHDRNHHDRQYYGRERSTVGRRQVQQQRQPYPEIPLKGFMIQKEIQMAQQQAFNRRRQPNVIDTTSYQAVGRPYPNNSNGPMNVPRTRELSSVANLKEDPPLSTRNGNGFTVSSKVAFAQRERHFPVNKEYYHFEQHRARDLNDNRIVHERLKQLETLENMRLSSNGLKQHSVRQTNNARLMNNNMLQNERQTSNDRVLEQRNLSMNNMKQASNNAGLSSNSKRQISNINQLSSNVRQTSNDHLSEQREVNNHNMKQSPNARHSNNNARQISNSMNQISRPTSNDRLSEQKQFNRHSTKLPTNNARQISNNLRQVSNNMNQVSSDVRQVNNDRFSEQREFNSYTTKQSARRSNDVRHMNQIISHTRQANNDRLLEQREFNSRNMKQSTNNARQNNNDARQMNNINQTSGHPRQINNNHLSEQREFNRRNMKHPSENARQQSSDVRQMNNNMRQTSNNARQSSNTVRQTTSNARQNSNDHSLKSDNRSTWSDVTTTRRQQQQQQQHLDNHRVNKPRYSYNNYNDVLRRMNNNIFSRQSQRQHERDTNCHANTTPLRYNGPHSQQKQRRHDERSLEKQQRINSNAMNPLPQNLNYDDDKGLHDNTISNRGRASAINNRQTYNPNAHASINARSSNNYNRRKDESSTQNRQANNAQSRRHKRFTNSNAKTYNTNTDLHARNSPNKRNIKESSNKSNKQSNNNVQRANNAKSSWHERFTDTNVNAYNANTYANKKPHTMQNGKETISSSTQDKKQPTDNTQNNASGRRNNMVNQDYIENLKTRVQNKNNDDFSPQKSNPSDGSDQHVDNKKEITGYNINMAKLKLLMRNSEVNLSELNVDSMRNIAARCMDVTKALMEEDKIDFDTTEECWE